MECEIEIVRGNEKIFEGRGKGIEPVLKKADNALIKEIAEKK